MFVDRRVPPPEMRLQDKEGQVVSLGTPITARKWNLAAGLVKAGGEPTFVAGG